jgi:hypothetical protein
LIAQTRNQLACFGGEAQIILVARLVEQRLQLRVGESFDQGGFADDRLAAALDDLLGEPGEVLARFAVGGSA